MKRWAITGFAVTIALLAASDSARGAEAPAAPEQPKSDLNKAADLVKKLGDRSWQTRHSAEKQLADMGRAAQKVLQANLTNPDVEISQRCEHLLELASRTDTVLALDAYLQKNDDKLLMKLPGWIRFSEMAGKDDSARMLFVNMYSTETELLDELEKDPKNFGPKLNTHITQLQQVLWNPWGGNGNVDVSQVVALLYVASDSRVNFDINTFYMITNFLYQGYLQQDFKANPAARRVLAAFIDKRADQNTLAQVMNVVLQMELKELVPVALKMATSKDTQAYNKSMAALVVGRMGTKEEADKLAPLLEDKTNLGNMQVGTQMLNAQLRDVALAAMIEAYGESPAAYGFPYLQQNQIARGNYVAPAWYGFAKEEDRAAALKKFREFKAKQAKK